MIWLLLFLVVVVAGGVVVLVTGIYSVQLEKFGVVYRRFGRAHPGDGPFEVSVHGSPGFQAETLKANRRYLRPRLLFEVEDFPRIHVPAGTIGLVVAKVGAPPPLTRTLGKHVECDYFQDGRAFLLGGGQKGRQLGVLPGDASYAINPKIFDVIAVDTVGAGRDDLTAADLMEIGIPEGTTGVVVVSEGENPDDDEGVIGRCVPGHEHFQLPSVFLDNKGQRGVQEETLNRGGVYRINPWFASVELIPTRLIVLEWTKRARPDNNFDAMLDQIRVCIEGHWLRCDVSQIIRIPAKAAPRLVSLLGQQENDKSNPDKPLPVRRLVDRVLSPLVEGYFNAAAGGQTILDFLANYNQVRMDLEEVVRAALADWDIEAVRTTLSEFVPEDTSLDEFRRRVAMERDRGQELVHQHENVIAEKEIEELRLDTEQRRAQLELQGQIDLLGEDAVRLKIYLEGLANISVPQVVSGEADALLKYMPLPIAQDMIVKALRGDEAGTGSPAPARLNATPGADRRWSQSSLVQTTLPITIYLSDESAHEEVEAAVEDLLAAAGGHIEHRDDPVFGSWFRRMRARTGQAVHSPLAHEASVLAVHAAKSHFVHAQDAAVTATMLQNLGPVLAALQPTKDAVIRADALLIVKVDWIVGVHQLTPAQQLQLDHQPQLAQSPHDILSALDRRTGSSTSSAEVVDDPPGSMMAPRCLNDPATLRITSNNGEGSTPLNTADHQALPEASAGA
ncbi:MAG TPA: SPFH domain-containing protein [Pseudonocardiaceae bacterium]